MRAYVAEETTCPEVSAVCQRVNARRVIEQLPQCDVAPLGVLRQELAERIRQAQPPVADEPKYRGRSELLRDRADAIDGACFGGEMPIAITLAEASEEESVRPLDDGHRRPNGWRLLEKVARERIEACDKLGTSCRGRCCGLLRAECDGEQAGGEWERKRTQSIRSSRSRSQRLAVCYPDVYSR